MKVEKQKKLTVLLCPPGIWEFLREILDMDWRSTPFTHELCEQIMQALAQVRPTETNIPLFAFHTHSVTVRTREALFQTIGCLSAGKSLLVCIVLLADNEYQICKQEEQAQALETSAHAGNPASRSVPRPDPAPDAFLEQEYEDRASGSGQLE
jgi:hypothetical protein